MPTATPDWSDLASEYERVVSPLPAAAEALTAHRPAARYQHGARRLAWRRRAAQGATACAAAALAVTAVAPDSASAAVPPLTWHLVRQVHQGGNSGITAITAVGTNGGWAFGGSGLAAPQAFRRSGQSWTQEPFPGRGDETVVAAQASAATNVWAFTSDGTRSRALRFNGSSWSVAGTFGKVIGGAIVLGPANVWVFGGPFFPGAGLGAWHFNGHGWTHVADSGVLTGGSASGPGSVWAFGGTKVARWTGRTWAATSVAALLPAKDPNHLNDPAVTALYAQSPTSVWAIGNGNREDDGGPLVVLHYNGHAWSRVASSITIPGIGVTGQVAPDGQGGLWIPMPAPENGAGLLVHYAGGHLTAAPLPVPGNRISVQSIAWIPGTRQALAGGYTHAAGNPGTGAVSVILQDER